MELRHLLNLSNFELFDFDYHFDDKQFASELEEHIIDYYYFHEIGQETPDHFKHVFRSRFKRMIGYYNELYNTTLLEYNPLINYSMTEAQEQLRESNTTQDNTEQATAEDSSTTNNTRTDNLVTEGENTTTNNSTVTSNSEGTLNTNTKSSDYPQQPIAGGDFLDGEQDTTTATTDDNTTTNTGTVNNEGITTNTGTVQNNGTTAGEGITNVVGQTTSQATDNSNYEKTIEGITGTSYQDLIKKQREGIMRLIPMIIDELKPCFIMVY